MEIKIATRACRDPEGADRTFTYYLTVDQEEGPRFCLRELRGAHRGGAGRDSACLPGLTTSAARIDQLMTLLVDNRVGPAGLADIVADWL